MLTTVHLYLYYKHFTILFLSSRGFLKKAIIHQFSTSKLPTAIHQQIIIYKRREYNSGWYFVLLLRYIFFKYEIYVANILKDRIFMHYQVQQSKTNCVAKHLNGLPLSRPHKHSLLHFEILN